MIREYRQMKAAMKENNNSVSYVYGTLVPDTVSNLAHIVRDQRTQMLKMCDNIKFALDNPDAIDLMALSYGNARFMLATYMETCHQQGVNASYMQGLYEKAGHDFDDDNAIYKLYNLLNRPYPVNLYYFNKVRMVKEKR